jgi:deoxyribodipyrimidine photo-lyase
LKTLLNIVWFKRDLRLHDHAALTAAAARGPVLGLVVYEPSLWMQPDVGGRHAAFYAECLTELLQQAEQRAFSVLVLQGEMPQVLVNLHQALGRFCLLSHEETGNWASFERDRRVRRWCRANDVDWLEYSQNNVVRVLPSRDDWARVWEARMSVAARKVPALQALSESLKQVTDELNRSHRQPAIQRWQALASEDNCPGRQMGGRSQGLSLLNSFLEGRGLHYRSHMSSPGTAETSCSRVSPHLTWGSLSIREVVQAVWRARAQWQREQGHPDQRTMLASLKSFESRLHWHCHFIQKLETEPEIEFRCLHPATRSLRNEAELSLAERERLQAWSQGRTGLPFVDACMRYLQHEGWINFRMRAMLISFASQHLWLHWRSTGEHLARLFTDYEPGIHWPQIQMQSGTTGINTIRIYNPEKQRHDQDPTGAFVARWIPELGTSDYPAPIVDHRLAAKAARDCLWGLRASPEATDQAQGIYRKHGSRNPAREGRPAGQGRGAGQKGQGRASKNDRASEAPAASIQPELDF